MDSDIAPGKDWRDEIDNAIRSALAVIVIMSPQARASEYVTYEWAFAWGAGIPVIPIMLKPTELHPRLEALQYLDFTARDPADRPWGKLFRRLWEIEQKPPRRPDREPTPTSIPIPPDAPPPVRQAVIDLDSSDTDKRLNVIESLGKITHPTAIEVLAQAAQVSPYSDVRFQAAVKLVELTKYKDTRAVPALIEALRIEALRDEDFYVRRQAADALVKIGDVAVPALIETLRDEDDDVRRQAAGALGEIGDAAVPALIEALRDESFYVREQAAEALGLIGDAAAVPALIEALRDEDSDVRRQAAEALGEIGDVTAVPALIETLRDEDSAVRRQAAEALGEIGDVTAVPALIETLRDEVTWVRGQAAEALGEIGDVTAMSALEEASRDENTYVREQANKALFRIIPF